MGWSGPGFAGDKGVPEGLSIPPSLTTRFWGFELVWLSRLETSRETIRVRDRIRYARQHELALRIIHAWALERHFNRRVPVLPKTILAFVEGRAGKHDLNASLPGYPWASLGMGLIELTRAASFTVKGDDVVRRLHRMADEPTRYVPLDKLPPAKHEVDELVARVKRECGTQLLYVIQRDEEEGDTSDDSDTGRDKAPVEGAAEAPGPVPSATAGGAAQGAQQQAGPVALRSLPVPAVYTSGAGSDRTPVAQAAPGTGFVMANSQRPAKGFNDGRPPRPPSQTAVQRSRPTPLSSAASSAGSAPVSGTRPHRAAFVPSVRKSPAPSGSGSSTSALREPMPSSSSAPLSSPRPAGVSGAAAPATAAATTPATASPAGAGH